MRLADARALLPELAALARDAARERQRRESLACWAGGFTSEVCLPEEAAILLEIGASLRLFGGLDPLLGRIMRGIDAQGHAAVAALAPTPQAALWLAGQGAAAGSCGALIRCPEFAEMREALSALPVSALDLSPAEMTKLSGFGVRLLGDLLRLPRTGLTRRLGLAFTQRLARALGELPDPRPRFVFPDRFREPLELPFRVDDVERLFFAAQRLLASLCGWLSVRAAGVAECLLLLHHEDGAACHVVLAFGSATRDAGRIGRVLRERLARLGQEVRMAPVVALELLAEATESLPGRERGLFGDAAAGEGVEHLIERLCARLGEASVHTLVTVAAHRPECASRLRRPGTAWEAGELVTAGPRPCWLLPQPKPLSEIDGRPQHGGPLKLLAGPERIESGWWDAGEPEAPGDVRRDYFIALSPHQERLWIFRDAAGWFLHGFYA